MRIRLLRILFFIALQQIYTTNVSATPTPTPIPTGTVSPVASLSPCSIPNWRPDFADDFNRNSGTTPLYIPINNVDSSGVNVDSSGFLKTFTKYLFYPTSQTVRFELPAIVQNKLTNFINFLPPNWTSFNVVHALQNGKTINPTDYVLAADYSLNISSPWLNSKYSGLTWEEFFLGVKANVYPYKGISSEVQLEWENPGSVKFGFAVDTYYSGNPKLRGISIPLRDINGDGIWKTKIIIQKIQSERRACLITEDYRSFPIRFDPTWFPLYRQTNDGSYVGVAATGSVDNVLIWKLK